MSYGSEPLQDSQVEPLVAILARHRKRDPLDSLVPDAIGREQLRLLSSLSPMGRMLGAEPITDEAIAAAGAILTSSQIHTLRQLQQEQAGQEGFLTITKLNPEAPSGRAPAAPDSAR